MRLNPSPTFLEVTATAPDWPLEVAVLRTSEMLRRETSSASTTGVRLRVVGRETTPAEAMEDEGPGTAHSFRRDSAAELLDLRSRWQADAMLDPLGLYILIRVAGTDGVPFRDLMDYLQGPEGWIAIARLVRAGFLDENGLALYATPSGQMAAHQMVQLAGAV